jgi:hypothetical protein
VFASRFFVLPDWAPYATATCKCPRAWQAAMAASPRGKQRSGTVGCREYTQIFVSWETAPCSRASARVLVRGAAWMRHFLAKESAGNAGSKRASERLCPKNTDASLVDRPTHKALYSGTWPISVFFLKRGGKRSFARNRFARDARRRRDAVARRRRGWRSVAHTASLIDSANRRHVWSPDAARLA